jgi:hypothetical protein
VGVCVWLCVYGCVCVCVCVCVYVVVRVYTHGHICMMGRYRVRHVRIYFEYILMHICDCMSSLFFPPF